MATIAFATGFEPQFATASVGSTTPATAEMWDSISGTPGISTTTYRNGAAALEISAAASTAEYVNLVPPATSQRIIGSFYFRLSALPTGGDFRVLSTSTSAGGQIFLVTTAGALIAEPGGNAGDRQTGPTVSTGTWYRIDFDSNTSGTNHTIDWKVNGTTYTQAVTTDAPGAQDQTNIRIGTTGTTHTNALSCFYDDFIISYTAADYPLGEYKVLGYSPNADADLTQVGSGAFVDAGGTAISGSNPAYDNLSVIDKSTTRVEQTAADGAAYIEIAFEDSAESTAPAAVMAIGSFRADSATATRAEARLNDNGTIDNWTGLFDPSETGDVQRWKCYATKPSGGAWTDTAFDGLKVRFGFDTDANPDSWYNGFMLEAAFAVAAGTAYNQTAAITATLTPDILKTPKKVVALTSTLTPAFSRLWIAAKTIAVTATLTPVVTRLWVAAKTIAVTATLTPAIKKATTKATFAIGSTLTVASQRATSKLQSVTASGTVAVRRAATKLIAQGLTGTVTFARLAVYSRLVEISSTLSAAITKAATKLTAITGTFTAAYEKVYTPAGGTPYTKQVDITATLSPGVIKATTKLATLTATLTVAFSRLWIATKTIAVGATLSVAKTLKIQKLVSIGVTGTAAMTRQWIASKTIALTTTLTPVVQRATRITKDIGATLTAAFEKVYTPASGTPYTELVQVTSTMTVGVTRATRKIIDRTATLTTAISRRAIVKSINLSASVTLAVRRTSTKLVALTSTFTPAIVKSLAGRVIAVGLTATPAVTKAVRKVLSTLGVTLTAAYSKVYQVFVPSIHATATVSITLYHTAKASVSIYHKAIATVVDQNKGEGYIDGY